MRHRLARLITFALVLALLAASGPAGAGPLPQAPAFAPDVSPTVVSYQGLISVSGGPYSGTGYFKFAVLDGTSNTVWSNDGTSVGGSEPTASVALGVSNGLFNVLLGDTTLGGMTQPLGAAVFSGADRALRVWFSSDNVTFAQLTPDRRIAAVPYALQAAQASDAGMLNGLPASYYLDASNVNAGTLGNAYFSAYADLGAEGYLGDDAGDLARNNSLLQATLNADLLDTREGSFYQDASNLNAGTVPNARFSAYADLGAEGYLGNAAGDLAQNNGLLQTTLNADQVDGRDAGNAAGDIPINNNTLNTNLNADRLDGLHAVAFQQHWAGVVVVAKSGGDYTTVQGAIDSIVGAGASNPYLVWVAPGVYSETVSMKPYIHVQGGGQGATVITSTASATGWPPGQYTLLLASHTSLRDLTVVNTGTSGSYRVALVSGANMTDTLVADVTARSTGAGSGTNYAIGLPVSNNRYVTLQHVTAYATGANTSNYGLYADAGVAVLIAGSYTGSGGNVASGILSSATIRAENVTALGEHGVMYNYGLHVGAGSAVLLGGSFTGDGAGMTYGVYSNAALSANAVTALGDGGTMNSYGLYNDTGTAVLVGGSYAGRGSSNASGIHNGGTLNAGQVTALGVALSTGGWSVGLYQQAGVATLAGGTYTGRGGDAAYGVFNGATLSGDDIVALGEAATVDNWGLANSDGVVTLRGGTFTGRGGTTAAETYGIWSSGTLAADNVVALGDEGTGTNGGIVNNGGTATLQDGTFTGRGGDIAFGISNGGTAVVDDVTAHGRGATTNYGLLNSGAATLRGGSYTGSGGGGGGAYGLFNMAALTAGNITATGENNPLSWGLFDSGMGCTITLATLTGTITVQMTLGPVDVSNSRLVGNAVAGPVTCTAVSRGLNFVGIGPGPCP